jgi:hypothetical protein
MFYKIYKANELKKQYEKNNNLTFDIVVRYRANVQFLDDLNFENIELNTIYNAGSGENRDRGSKVPPSIMTQDMFFYANSKVMDTICDLYNNLSYIMHKYEGAPSYIGPERLLYDWVFYENQIKHKTSNIPFTYWN